MVPARWTVPVHAPLQDAAHLMRAWDVRDVFVVDEGSFRGILGDVDIVVVAIASGRSPSDMTAGECVAADAPRLHADEPVADALTVMAHHQLQRAPVVDGDELVGAVWIADLEAAVLRPELAPREERRPTPVPHVRRRRPERRPERRHVGSGVPAVTGAGPGAGTGTGAKGDDDAIAPLFQVEPQADESGAGIVLALTGELDLHTVATFVVALDAAIAADGVSTVTIDARRLTFADSSAIHALLRARGVAAERGVRLRLANVAGSLERTLVLTGMDTAFDITDG
jgi:anti-anti-sigma factor